MTNREQAVAELLAEEIGVKDLGDGKGTTWHGQTLPWLQEFGLEIPQDEAHAARNYHSFLEQTGIGFVVDRDVGLGYFVFDDAIHSGHVQAIKDLQRSLGVDVDGDIGPQTLGALAATNAGELAAKLVADRCVEIGDLLASKTIDRRHWSRGWHNRLSRQILRLPKVFRRNP